MRERLSLGGMELELRWGYDAFDTGAELRFHSPAHALSFLHRSGVGASADDTIRRVLAATDPSRKPSPSRTADLMDLLARRIAEGRIVVAPCGGGSAGTGGGASAGSSSTASSSTSAANATASSSSSTASTEASSTAAAAAATTSSAASTATAPPPSAAAVAAADAAAAAAADDAALDAETQAETLQQAAESGAPFCEECEKRKQKQAAQASGATP